MARYDDDRDPVPPKPPLTRYSCKIVYDSGVEQFEGYTDDRGQAEQYCRDAVADHCRSAAVVQTVGSNVVSYWDAEELDRFTREQAGGWLDDGPAGSRRYQVIIRNASGVRAEAFDTDSRGRAEGYILAVVPPGRGKRNGTVHLAADPSRLITAWSQQEVALWTGATTT